MLGDVSGVGHEVVRGRHIFGFRLMREGVVRHRFVG